MTNVLSFDTTSGYASISISYGEQIIIEHNFITQNNLASTLVPAIEFVLNSVRLRISDIDVFGIGIGPGLFTGIRVGLSTLKGLIFKEMKPVVPVITLKALAYKSFDSNSTIISLIDAKRDEVYIAGYNFINNNVKEVIAPDCVHIHELKTILKEVQNFNFIGSGAEVYGKFIKKNLKKSKIFHRSPFLSSEICRIAFNEYKRKNYINDLKKLLPLYIRRPDALKVF